MNALNETRLILTEVSKEMSNVEMNNYLVYAFILLGILLIIFIIETIINNIKRG
jgi:hypothetical protein